MSSPLSFQLTSSHVSSATSMQNERMSSTDKPGVVTRTSSTNPLHRSTSSKSNLSTAATSKGHKHHHHHAHVAHTSASKHQRTTNVGHRVPSYGKGLNKLTALATANTSGAPKEYLSIHSIADRAGGATLQRCYSEGSSTSF